MGFSEKIKNGVRKRSFFRCCICHSAFIEIHHIVPLSEKGCDTFNNAAPLCASCHDLFGANPDKRRRIKQMRDNWYEQMDKLKLELSSGINFDSLFPIQKNQDNINFLYEKGIALYHIVFKEEGFVESANALFRLVREAQKTFPYHNRILFLDIEDHRNEDGGFDWDMFELIRYFILEFLLQYLSKAYTPLVCIENKKLQKKLDAELRITESDDEITKIARDNKVDEINIEFYPKREFLDKMK